MPADDAAMSGTDTEPVAMADANMVAFAGGETQATSSSSSSSRRGYWGGVGQVFLGYGDAAVGIVTGVYTMVRHPIQTTKGVGNAIAHPINTFNAVKDDVVKKSQSNRGSGELVGDVLIGVATGGALKAAKESAKVAKLAKAGDAFPNRLLPRDINGKPVPDVDFPHTVLGRKKGRNGDYPQAREFDADGKPVRDIDFTDHGRPSQNHTNPHQHRYFDNPTGGTPRRGPAEPLF